MIREDNENLPSVFSCLEQIFECGAFELCQDKTAGDFLVPYMMNDALEYYLRLKDCRMTGEYLPESEVLSVELIDENREEEEQELTPEFFAEKAISTERWSGRYVLILRQENGNVCSLYFKDIFEHAQCYQYHRIGHFWVKGQERWRQLVYKIGTVYDKYEYFGERFCNEKERAIRDLILFGPFRHWSPLTGPLESCYPEAQEGLAVMAQLAAEAGDETYLRWVKIYKAVLDFSLTRWLFKKRMERWLAKKLLSPKRQVLYELIYRKVCEASLEYPERDYGPEINAGIEKERCSVDEKLRQQGFVGAYPEYEKDGRKWVAMEEHPFTIMESENFKFKIQMMEQG